MKRYGISIAAIVLLTVVGISIAIMFPRPPKEAAALMSPILQDRMRADDAHYSPGSPEWDLEDRLDQLTKTSSSAADTASVLLLDYYLGEHNGETELCAVTSRGARVMPLLKRYRSHKAGLMKPWYWGIALNKVERESMYTTAVDAIQNGKVIGCE